ncbi:FLYWCH zinc finger domain-containing protein [Phthorimaea operculella]|nr:FLYWCH zinc finger domain-containing protein [Phthorimaea operculella]
MKLNNFYYGANGPVFTKTRAGKPLLLLNGYRYYKSPHCDGSRLSWYCRRIYKGQTACRASVVTVDDVIISIKHEHNHPVK